MELNDLTKRLFAKGHTKDKPPDFVRPFDEFYGGFTYKSEYLRKLVFETPCGLLLMGEHFVSGCMSYMGVNWMPENNNPTVPCPRFSREPCMLNHELLRNHRICGDIVNCNCHLTDRAYDYEMSFDKAHDDVWKEADERFEQFAVKKHGRVCRLQSRYNRMEKRWSTFYDPIRCACDGFCQYCDVLQTDLSPKKGNVFYDLKIIATVKGFGLFPDQQKTTVIKGKKLLEKTASITICEAIVRYAKFRIQKKEEDRASHIRFHDPSYSIQVMNIRAERRESRDLIQDLRDAAEGMEVVHAGDLKKSAAKQKHERRQAYIEKKIRRIEQLILENGMSQLEEIDRIRARRLLSHDRICELVKQYSQRAASKNNESTQLSLF